MRLALPTRFSTLQLALGVSIAVHGALLGVRFVDPEGFRSHYETTAARIAERLAEGSAAGHLTPAESELAAEVRAWALMGMNVFLGLRFGVWGSEDPGEVAAAANALLRQGLAKR